MAGGCASSVAAMGDAPSLPMFVMLDALKVVAEDVAGWSAGSMKHHKLSCMRSIFTL